MNKLMKVFLILGILIVLVSLPFIRSYESLEKQFNRNNIKLEDKSVTFELEEINYIDLKTSNTKISVKKAKDNKFKIDYQESKYQKYEYEIVNNKLVMSDNNEKALPFTFGINFGITFEPNLTIYIPESEISLIVKTSNSSINLTDELSFKNAKLISSNGSIKVSNQNITNKLILKSSNSSISASYVEAGDSVSVKTSNGGINIKNIKTKELDATTSNAKISLEKLSDFEIITAKSSNGSIISNDVKSNRVSFTSSNSSIKVEDLDSNNITLKSSNGSIKGTIIGSDYDFNKDFKTSNGSVTVDNAKYGNELRRDEKDAEKRISAKTSNSSISIDFTK